jgi:hypothetical protein
MTTTKTFCNGTVAKDAKTGRFVSVKSLKPMAIKENKTKVEKVTGPVVEILSALYGIEGNRINITPIVGKKLNNKMAGSDPAPKVKKDAIIKAKVEGKEVEKVFTEGEVITFA